jgi:5-hydroxyisourate hydrolase-like protein (transthyretin family)
MNKWKAFLFLAFLLPLGATKIFACSCAGRALPCQDYWNASAVFIGTVSSSTTASYKINEREFEGRLIHFAVDRAFRDVEGAEVEVTTGLGGGDCGYNFRVGGQYLVYAYRNANNKLATGICNRTRLLSEASEDLQYLEGLAKSKSGADIFGEVRRLNGPTTVDPTAVSAVKVVIEGSSRRVEAVTNEKGNYRISQLPAGSYTVKVELPEGLAIHNSEQQVTLSDRGCAQVSFWLQTDTRIAGVVLDTGGQPVSEILIELVLLSGRSPAYTASAKTDQKGRYELKLLQPGRYLVGVRIYGSAGSTYVAYPRTYYPGVSEEAQATIITLAEGQQLNLNEMILPPRLFERSLDGVVVDTDGQPVSGAIVWLKENEYADHDMPYRNTTDSEGRFSFKTYEGMSYHLNAYLELAENKRKQADMDIRISSNPGTIKLVLIGPK